MNAIVEDAEPCLSSDGRSSIDADAAQRKRIMFYCRRGRDRFIAEQLVPKLQNCVCVLAGHIQGKGYFLRYDKSEQTQSSEVSRQIGSVPLVRKIRQSLFWWAPVELIAYRLWLHGAGQLIDSEPVDALVLFEENVGDASQAMAAAAKKRGIPYIILPQTIPNSDEPAAFYGAALGRDGSTALARLVTAIWPQWGYVYRGRRLILLPIGAVLAQHLAGFSPRTPWVLNSGNARVICVECKALGVLYRSLGFPAEQLLVCGHPVDDTLHAVQCERESRRRALDAAFGMDPQRPLVVVAFPPNQFTSPDTSRFEWPDFESMCRAWCEALGILKRWANVVVCRHPRLSNDDLRIVTESGFSICLAPTEEMVPLADLYVASISATIRWALACGVPVLNYDCYRYGYRDYDSAAGVLPAADLASFRRLCESVIAEPQAYQKLKQKAQLDRHNWGEIDGCFAARFGAILEDVSRQSVHLTTPHRPDVRRI